MADVGISVKLDGLAQVQSGLKGITRDTQTMGNEAEKAGKKVDHIGGALKGLRNSLGALGLGYAAREAIQMADAMTNMRSRINLVVHSNEKAAETQQKLLEIANRTRSSFEAVGSLYSRVGRSADALGISQERLLGFTETFSQALKISGASTAEAESTILQLSQALASGRLQGAELNAVLEAGGRAATALAAGLNVPIGSLKKLGEAGLLTSEVVIKAIESQGLTIKNEFDGMQMTVSDAMTVLYNSFAEVIGKLNETTGTTKTLSGAIVDLANYMKEPATLGAIRDWVDAFTALASVLGVVADVANAVDHGLNMLLSDALYQIGAIDKATNAATRNRTLTSMAGQGATNVRDALHPKVWKPSGMFGGSALGGDGGWAAAPEAQAGGGGAAAFDFSAQAKKLMGGTGSGAAASKAARDAMKEMHTQLNMLRDDMADAEAIQSDMWDAAQSKIEGVLTPMEKYRAELEDVDALYAGGTGPLTFENMSRVVDDMNRKLAESNATVMDIEDAFDRAFDAAISGTEDLGQALEDIGKDLAKNLFKDNILNPARDSLNTAIGGLLGGGGGKEKGGQDAFSMLGGDAQDPASVFDNFLGGLQSIFGDGDKGFLGSLQALFIGDNGILTQLGDIFSGAWEILSGLFTSFLSEQGILHAWAIAEGWAIELWATAERWAIAIFEAAAGLFGFETGGELTVTRPTLFVAGEKNKAEHIRVSPLSGGSRNERRGGSGGYAGMSGEDTKGSSTTNVQVFIPQTSVISGLTEGSFARKITSAVNRQRARTV